MSFDAVSSLQSLTRSTLTDMQHRFSTIMNPSVPDFNPLTVAACPVDPPMAAVLFTVDGSVLMEPAKMFLVQEV